MAISTAESKERYKANRRQKYREDADYRAKVNARNRAERDKKRDQINAKRKERYWSDPEYRERQIAPRRGRCQRDTQLKVHYGIGLEEYRAMETAQEFVCAICAQPAEDTLCVDHCHSTSKVRGLLCRKCNTGLGCFKDEPDLMIKAIAYLEKHRGY